MKKVAIVIAVLLALVATGGGFFWAGMKVEENRIAGNPGAFFQGQFGQQQGQFPGGFPRVVGTPEPGAEGLAGRGGIMGSIKAIEGDTLVVTTQEGDVRVLTTDTTLIQKNMTVAVEDLEVGEQVTVSGSKNDDGSVTARSIRSVGAFQPPQSEGQ